MVFKSNFRRVPAWRMRKYCRGYSPDLNVCENLGAILEDRVEEMISRDGAYLRSDEDRLLEIIESELGDMAADTELLETLLKSYPARLETVKKVCIV